MKKYIVIPGEVRSQNDGDIHFISAQQLIHLYGVDPKECKIVTRGEAEIRGFFGDWIFLFPRQDGNYTIPSK